MHLLLKFLGEERRAKIRFVNDRPGRKWARAFRTRHSSRVNFSLGGRREALSYDAKTAKIKAGLRRNGLTPPDQIVLLQNPFPLSDEDPLHTISAMDVVRMLHDKERIAVFGRMHTACRPEARLGLNVQGTAAVTERSARVGEEVRRRAPAFSLRKRRRRRSPPRSLSSTSAARTPVSVVRRRCHAAGRASSRFPWRI